MADPAAARALVAIQQLLGDIRLAILAADALLSIRTPDAGQQTGVTFLAIGVVWLARRPPPFLDATPTRVWALTGLDLLTAILVLAVTGVDSLALVYVAMTAATAALRLGRAGAVVAAAGVAAVHGVVVFSSPGLRSDPTVLLVLLVRLALVALTAAATARLRELLISREALASELQDLRERHIREAERARLAREMHDSLAKTLHGVALLVGRLGRRLAREAHPLAADAELIAQSLQAAQAEGRQILASLRQEPVHDLRQALTDLAHGWQAAHGIPVELRLPSAEPGLEEDAKAELLKSAAEILENVHRHAAASAASLILSQDADEVRISIADDGAGMPAPDLASLSGAGHFGLVGVHERMSRIGGRVEILAGAGPGTSVVLLARGGFG